MIRTDQIIEIGYFTKPHGIKGEITASIEIDLDIRSLSCIVIDVDGIKVPFFITGVRPKGADADLLTIDGVDDEKQAAEFANKTIYALSSEIDIDAADDGFYLDSLIGYTLMDSCGDTVGIINDVDFSSDNLLLLVGRDNGSTVYVPVAEELIADLDEHNKRLTLHIADGLIGMQ